MGDLSANFSRSEFRCPHCNVTGSVSADLVLVLQKARNAVGRPLRIVSGWRCPVQNRRVGGIARSEHLHGRAADVPGDYGSAQQWLAWGAHGVGMRRGRVVHVDVTPGRAGFIFND